MLDRESPPLSGIIKNMDNQELISILKIQSILGRSKSGWDLGEGMPEASSGSIVDIQNEEVQLKECLNCQMILSAEFFASGCPNCGSKDHKDVQGTQPSKQGV